MSAAEDHGVAISSRRKSAGGSASRILISALVGFSLGVAFPVVSTLISLLAHDMTPNWGAVLRLHQDEPLLQVIDSMPLVLGLAFGLVGRAVAKLEALIAGLEVRVKHRTAALESEKSDAESRARAKSAFLAHLSRELGKSVDVVLRDCEMLLGSTLDAQQKQLAQQSHVGIRQIKDTLRSVLTLSEAECGELELSRESFSATQVIDKVLQRIGARISSDIQLEVGYAPDLPGTIVADQQRLMKIFVTVLRTILLSAKSGTIRIDVSQSPGVQGRDSMLHIEIENPGLVIPAAQLERMFLSFDNVDPMSCGQDARTELDLAVVKRLSNAMGGDISVQSTAARGTKYYVSLPFELAPRAANAGPGASSPKGGIDLPKLSA